MLGWEFPPIKSGGLGTYLYHFTRELNALGNNVTFILPYTGRNIEEDFLKIMHEAPQTDFIPVPSPLTPYISTLASGMEEQTVEEPYGWNFFKEVAFYTKRAAELGKGVDFDVVHCHDWMTFPAGILLKRLTKKPLIVTIHSTEFDRTGQLYPNQGIKAIEETGLREADHIITVSNFMKKQLVKKYNIHPEKITVVYNAIDLSQYKKGNAKKPLDEKIVLFVGRLTIQKGCEFFLEAAKKVLEAEPNTRFLIVGTGDMLHQLIQKSIDLGISNNVTFTGFEENVNEYYSIADLFVMPSVSEPFGLTALEAMACNAPVIVSKQSGVSEVIKNVLKVDFWDTHELANKIINVLRYQCLSTELKKMGFNEITEYRNWSDVARETIQVYKGEVN